MTCTSRPRRSRPAGCSTWTCWTTLSPATTRGCRFGTAAWRSTGRGSAPGRVPRRAGRCIREPHRRHDGGAHGATSEERMTENADVIVIGAGVQGASLAFHLASRGARVTILERATAGAGATGRSSGLVRVYYDLLAEARLAWVSYHWFEDWDARVGGECGFTRTGFVWIEPAERRDRVEANSASHRAMGVDSSVLEADALRSLFPALAVGDEVAAYEPGS